MDELKYEPSLKEIATARKIFTHYLQAKIKYTKVPVTSPMYMSKELLIHCALAEVWRQGKITGYQH